MKERTFTEHSDQGEDEEHILARTCLPGSCPRQILGENELFADRVLALTVAGKCALQLDAPFSLGAVHLEHGNSHDEDDERREELENTWDVLC